MENTQRIIAEFPDLVGGVEGCVASVPSKKVGKTGDELSHAFDLSHRQPFPTYINPAMHPSQSDTCSLSVY
jgi:hypothetical protein